MRTVQLYIEGERDSGNYSEVELFNDESINLSLSVQNIQDISKVFTDFSQSFTVPASTINNAIFKHFYENDVDLDLALIDQRLKRNAYIEIDRTPFRNGKIQLEKSNLKDGQAQSYSITFYGDLVTLKDTFSDDKLSDLDYSNVDFTYTGTEVVNRLTTPSSSTDYDIRYPLITSDRVWSYGDSTSTDISITGGKIDYTELQPAVKVARIFDAIETKYNVNFEGLFLTDKRFTDLFLWCRNGVENNIRTNYVQLSNSVTTSYDISNPLDRLTSSLTLSIFNVSNTSAVWYVDVFVNGVFVESISESGNNSINVVSNVNGVVTCSVYSDATLTFDSDFVYTTKRVEFTPGGNQAGQTITNNSTTYNNSQVVLTLSSNIKTKMPDIKVADFFSGVLKQFNLTCYPLSINTFEIEPLDYWYQKGALNDITSFVDVDSIDVAKVPLYKRINFEHEKSKSFNNLSYAEALRKEYGDLSLNFEYDGSDFEVKVPFENLRFEKFEDENLTVAYSLESAPSFKPYTPKPILMYMYERQTCNGFYLYDGSSNQFITQYMPFGQDLLSDGINYSLNFGKETSTLLEASIPNSIYSIYYNNYLENLINNKNRLTSIKANFPTSLITNLKLNDRLIIRDKRYIINNIKTNLTSGEVDLELLNDFREISNANVTNELLPIGGVINVPVLVENNVEVVNVSTPTVGVTLGATTTFTTDGFLEVTYPANPNAGFERITENNDERVTERIDTRRSESGSEYIIEIDLESIYFNGEIKNESLFYIQGL